MIGFWYLWTLARKSDAGDVAIIFTVKRPLQILILEGPAGVCNMPPQRIVVAEGDSNLETVVNTCTTISARRLGHACLVRERRPLDPGRRLTDVVRRELRVEELREGRPRLTVGVGHVAGYFIAHPLADEILGPECAVVWSQVRQVAGRRKLGDGGVFEAHFAGTDGSICAVDVVLNSSPSDA